LNALRSFEAAARLGSFQLAADELFVTPSAVSHQIKTLEGFLGAPLFRREKRSITLTPAGEKYLSSVEHALDEIDLATRRLLARPNTSVVNISVVPAFLTRWLVPRIRQFQDKHPDVELRLSASTGRVDFAHSDTDMAIYFGRGEWEDVESIFLKKANLVPVCSPKLLEGDRALKSVADLPQHTLLYITDRKDEWDLALEKTPVSRSQITKGLTFSSTSLAIAAAMEGVGVALADLELVERELQYGQLIIPFHLEFDTKKAFYLAYQRGRQMTRPMQAFHDWILAEIGAQKRDEARR
jgi:LysR family glycine cleavage system transcriptional activator